MREILRVLKPGGKLVVIAETYKGGRNSWLNGPAMRLLLRAAHLSAEEERQLFAAVGYTDVQIIEERKRGWLCAIGVKPDVTFQ